MNVYRDYVCKCGCKYEGRHHEDETVLCPECRQPMRMLIGCPSVRCSGSQSKGHSITPTCKKGYYKGATAPEIEKEIMRRQICPTPGEYMNTAKDPCE